MRILVLIAVHGRHGITRLCYQGLKTLIEKTENEYKVLIVGNDHQHELLAKEFSYEYLHHENMPIGRKLNAALEYALRYEWDYMMQIGSDDIIIPTLIHRYKTYFTNKVPVFGVDNCVFLHPESKRAKWFKYDKAEIIGSGRCISREAIEASAVGLVIIFTIQIVGNDFRYMPGDRCHVPLTEAKGYIAKNIAKAESESIIVRLWKDDANRALDAHSMRTLAKLGYSFTVVPFDKGLFAIKSEENIWPYDSLPGEPLNYQSISIL